MAKNGGGHQLRQTKALKQAILDSLPAHIAVIDKQGIIVAVNNPWIRFAEENGLPDAESVCVGADYIAVCKKASDMADPLAREALEGIQSVLQGEREDFYLEYPCHSPTQHRWFQMTVTHPQYDGLGAIISHSNTTERKYWVDSLLLSEKKFTTIFKNVPALLAIALLVDGDGTLIEVNEAFLRTTGYTRDEVMGCSTQKLAIWANLHDRSTMLETLVSNGSVHDLEIKLRIKDGNLLTTLLSAELIDLNAEKHVLLMLKDITERKRMEEQITKLSEERAAYASKLESLNNGLKSFNYTVSHDLKNPLNKMTLRVQMIEQFYGAKLDEECKKDLREIFGDVLQMNDLINTLIEFSNVTFLDLKREVVDLGGIAHEVATELSQSDPERQVEFRIATGVMVNRDPKLVKIVLTNLISNAWKFTEKQVQAIIEFGAIDIAGTRTCFVRDNGPGFDESQPEKLFKPFLRLSDAVEHKGHGIGLATVERIVSHHGGKVWAEGSPGKGAVFYFTLE